jgi:hypothetical protein
VVVDLERVALPQDVGCLRLGRLDPEQSPAADEAEGEPLETGRQTGREADPVAVVAEPAEPRDGRDARAGEARDVEAVPGVVLEVVQVDEAASAK